MKRLKCSTASSAVLFILIVLQALQSEAMYFVFLTLTLIVYVVSARNSLPKPLWAIVFPLIIIFLLGLQGLVNHHIYNALKDAWYVIKPIFAIALGYLIGKRFLSVRSFFRIIITASVALAASHLFIVIYYLNQGLDLFQIRDEGVRGYFMVAVGMGLLLYHWRHIQYIAGNRINYFLAGILMGLSLTVSLSRTWMLCLLIVLIVLNGSFHLRIKSAIKALGLSGLVILTLLTMLSFSNFHDENEFLLKTSDSLREIAIKNYIDRKDINQHWRGYESYRALESYSKGTLFQKIFGQGMGSQVDLGLYINLGGKAFRYVPILHNGYLYVLVKFGAIGLMLYLYFLFRMVLIKISSRYGPEYAALGHTIVAIGWCLILTSLVITGIFNKSAMDSALIVSFASFALMNNAKCKCIWNSI